MNKFSVQGRSKRWVFIPLVILLLLAAWTSWALWYQKQQQLDLQESVKFSPQLYARSITDNLSGANLVLPMGISNHEYYKPNPGPGGICPASFRVPQAPPWPLIPVSLVSGCPRNWLWLSLPMLVVYAFIIGFGGWWLVSQRRRAVR